MLTNYLPEPFRRWWLKSKDIEETWGGLRWLVTIAVAGVVAMVWLFSGSAAAAGVASIIVASAATFFFMTLYGWTRGWNARLLPFRLPGQRREEMDAKRQLLRAFYILISNAEVGASNRGMSVPQFLMRRTDYLRMEEFLSDDICKLVRRDPSGNNGGLIDKLRHDAIRLEKEWGLLGIEPNRGAPHRSKTADKKHG